MRKWIEAAAMAFAIVAFFVFLLMVEAMQKKLSRRDLCGSLCYSDRVYLER